MKLSVIIPVYNVEKYIDQCLNSILNQGIPKEDYEIILIDDGSTDNSYNIAKNIADKNSNIQVYSQKNNGLSVTRNNGIKYAEGEYIYFVDSDDYLAFDSLDILLKFAIDNNLEILEFSSVRTKSRNFENSRINNISSSALKIHNGEKYISTRLFADSVWVYFYKRDFLINSEVKFINGRTMEDMIFTAELLSLAKRIVFYPIDVYRYVINPNTIWTSTESHKNRRSIYDFIFMTAQYTILIENLENKKVNTTILKSKKQTMLFNIAKRLLRSDFKYAEINQILKNLIDLNLYPLQKYKGKNLYRKLLTFLFNHKYLFYQTIFFYKIFRFSFEYFIVKNYQNKKEKQVSSSFKLF